MNKIMKKKYIKPEAIEIEIDSCELICNSPNLNNDPSDPNNWNI